MNDKKNSSKNQDDIIKNNTDLNIDNLIKGETSKRKKAEKEEQKNIETKTRKIQEEPLPTHPLVKIKLLLLICPY